MTMAADDPENYRDSGTIDAEDSPRARTIVLTPASEITPRPVLWLWALRLALGAFTCSGDARVSASRSWLTPSPRTSLAGYCLACMPVR